MHKTHLAAIVVAAFALLGGVAYASIPDGNGVIHGCYKPTSDGHQATLSVIDTAGTNGHCPSGTTELNWNQTGPQGPQGAMGATGPQGPAGQDGQDATKLWAVVTLPMNISCTSPPGPTCTNTYPSPILDRGVGVSSVDYASPVNGGGCTTNCTGGGETRVRVTFNQDVTQCSYSLARGFASGTTHGTPPTNALTPIVIPDATTSDNINWTAGDPNAVQAVVNGPSWNGNASDPNALEDTFFLQVFC